MGERFRSDVVTAIRALSRTPVPIVAAILTMAVSVGVNLAMFGLIDRALLSPPSQVADPGRLFTLSFGLPGDENAAPRMRSTSYPTFKAIRDGVPAFSDAAAFQRLQTSVIVDGEQLNANALLVTGNYFHALGATAMLGRDIQADDDQAAVAAPAAVLSQAFWSSAFHGDRAVLGRRFKVRGLDYIVTGVMPAGFSGHSTAAVDLWLPLAAAMRDSPGWDREGARNATSIVVRLAVDQNAAAARTQAEAAANRRIALESLGAEVAASEQRVAWWLAGVSMLVFLIGLANTATLLVVRGAKMRLDLAIRAALGASRARLVRQAMVEACLLAIAAMLASLVLASWMDETFRRVLFPGVIERAATGTNSIWAAAIAGLIAAALCAGANVWMVPSQFHHGSLARSGLGSTRRARTMTALLVLQTTLSVVLLAGAGMFGGSLYRLWAQDFGMQMDHVVVVDFEPGPGRIAGQDEIYSNALERVRQLPGVELATVIDSIPFTGFNVPPIAVPGRAESPSVGGQLPFLTAATPELVRILGIEVVEGRALTPDDDRGAPVVMVNQTMARTVWPGESAIGKCIRVGFDPDFDFASFDPALGPPQPTKVPCREVVGVIRDIRQRSVVPAGNEDRLMGYVVPFSQVPKPPFAVDPIHMRGLLLRTSAGLETLAPVIRRLIVGDRADLPFVNVRKYTSLLDRQMRPWSMGTTLLAFFSSLALTVSAVGLYAAFAFAVSERKREMAIRLAVGAARGRVLRMIIGEGMLIAMAGAGLGCGIAVAAGKWVQALLFGTTSSDPAVLGVAALVMLVVAGLATLLPARTASHSEPGALLRSE